MVEAFAPSTAPACWKAQPMLQNWINTLPWKRLTSNTGTVFLGLVMLAMIFLAYGTIANRFYRVITIDGNSMAPTFYYGDLVIVTPPKAQVAPGSIVLLSVNSRLVTHRLLGYENTGKPITQGDANRTRDDFSGSRVKIAGIYWFHVPKVGYLSLLIKQVVKNIGR